MKEMLKYLKPYRTGLFLATVAVTLSTVCELLLATIMSEILNNGVANRDLSYIVLCCAAMLVITIPILFFGGVALSMAKDVLLSLTLLAFVPVIFAIVIIIGREILPLWDKSDEYIDKQNDIMRVRLRGIRVIRVFNAEGLADPVARQDITFTDDIRFDKLSFRYEGAAESALKDISFHIRQGEKAAVIGGTGAGKSTVVSMLLGFCMSTEGKVYLDGIPTEKLSRHTMRHNMSCVLQNSTIYSGTVAENVRMGKENAPNEEVWEALRTAQAADFVASFENGLDHGHIVEQGTHGDLLRRRGFYHKLYTSQYAV